MPAPPSSASARRYGELRLLDAVASGRTFSCLVRSEKNLCESADLLTTRQMAYLLAALDAESLLPVAAHSAHLSGLTGLPESSTLFLEIAARSICRKASGGFIVLDADCHPNRRRNEPPASLTGRTFSTLSGNPSATRTRIMMSRPFPARSAVGRGGLSPRFVSIPEFLTDRMTLSGISSGRVNSP